MSTFSTELINKLGFLISFAPISSLPVSLFHVSSFMAMHPTATSAGSRGLARITYSPAVQSDAPTLHLFCVLSLSFLINVLNMRTKKEPYFLITDSGHRLCFLS